MKRRINTSVLEKKKKKLQHLLKLDNWTINIKFVPKSRLPDERTTAQVDYCSCSERVASVVIYDKYWLHDGFEVAWNLETLLLHEFIHILLMEQFMHLPHMIQENAKFMELEEFICDIFAKIIFDTYNS